MNTKVYENQNFKKLLTDFLPSNFVNKSMYERKNMVREFEKYAAQIQNREEMKIYFFKNDNDSIIAFYDGEDACYIGEDALNIKNIFLDIFASIFHEPIHYLQKTDPNNDMFSDIEKRFFNRFGYKEIAYYPISQFGYFKYYFQPAEYSAFRETYLNLNYLLDFMINNIDETIVFYKQLVDKKYNMYSIDFNDKNFYDITVKNIQKSYFDLSYVRERVAVKAEQLISKLLNNTKELTKDELFGLYINEAWTKLDFAEKRYVIKETIKQIFNINLSEDSENLEFLLNSANKKGINVFKNVLMLYGVIKTNIDLKNEVFQDYSKYINMMYDLNNEKKHNSYIKEEDVAFFNSLEYKKLKENYFENMSNFIDKLKTCYSCIDIEIYEEIKNEKERVETILNEKISKEKQIIKTR